MVVVYNIQNIKQETNLTMSAVTGELSKFLRRRSNCKLGNDRL